MRLSLIGDETYQGKCGEISRGFKALRKTKQDQEMYEKEFDSNQISKPHRAGVFRSKIERS